MMLIDRPRSCLVALCLCALALATPATAGAQTLPFGLGFGLVCGLGHSEPVPLQVEENGPLRLASMNATTRILADTDFDGTTSVKQTVALRLFDLQGNLEWKAGPFVLKSFEFVSSINFPGFDGVTPAPGALPDTSTHLAVYPPFGTECNGVGVATHGGKRYVVMTIGTVASAGTAEQPQDLSKVILYVFDAGNGNVVRKHKVVPRDGWFLSGFGGPAVLDTDGDGNYEVVVARVRGLSNNRAEFLYESFNLVTGNREQRTRIIQKNKEANENPEFGVQDVPSSSE